MSSELASAPQKSVSRLALFGSILLSSVVAGVIGLQLFPLFEPPEKLLIPTPPPEIAVAREASFWKCRLANSQVLIAGIFAVLAGGLWAVSLGRKSPVTFLKGAVSASAICAAGVFLGHLIMEIRVEPNYEMYKTVASQVVMMAFLGLGLGVALGWGQGSKPWIIQYGQNGFVAGIAAAVIYIAVTSLLLSDSQTDVLVPGGVLKGNKDPVLLAVWFSIMAVIFSLIIPKQSKSKKSADQAAQA